MNKVKNITFKFTKGRNKVFLLTLKSLGKILCCISLIALSNSSFVSETRTSCSPSAQPSDIILKEHNNNLTLSILFLMCSFTLELLGG